jgi:ubiquinone/menaquinone biosynthesis C-methylase UbiE
VPDRFRPRYRSPPSETFSFSALGSVFIAACQPSTEWKLEMAAETEKERALRERKRAGFEHAAERYDATRSGYPEELVSRVVAKARLGLGRRVLEIGCGTGQLTRALVGCGADLIAIDPAPSMIAVAQQRLSSNAVEFRMTTFEDFEAPEAAFDLIVSATAFHWVDPGIAWAKSARLLRPGGWLALLSTGEKYDEPVGQKVFELYLRNSSGPATWAEKPSEEAARQEQSLEWHSVRPNGKLRI